MAPQYELALSPHRQRLVALLRNRHKQQGYPLSLSQRRLWFLSQLVPNSPFYNMPGAVRLQGRLSILSLEQALFEVVRRHETLRTVYVSRGGEPVQIVQPSRPLALCIVDLRKIPTEEREAAVGLLQQEETGRGFDLSIGPVLRAKLLWMDAEDYVLLLNIHHIVSDGWSQQVLLYELSVLQNNFIAGIASPLSELAIQYADYASWQHKWVSGDSYRRQLDYWTKQLHDLEELRLPTDRPRPHIQTFRGATTRDTVEQHTSDCARELARTEKTTLFMVLLAAFVALLHRYTGQYIIVTGTPTANRKRPETASLIGLFTNMLVLKTPVERGITFRELLRVVRRVCLDAYDNEEFPFEKLVEELQPERDLSRNPFFQVVLVQLTPLGLEDSAGKASQTSIEVSSGATKFDLQLNVQEEARALELIAEYSTDLFDQPTVARMLAHYRILLQAAMADPDASVGRLQMLANSETQRIVEEWNDNSFEYDREICLHSLFEAQVARRPDATAIVVEDKTLSYAQLDAAANKMAHKLRAMGVRPGVKVGVLLRRSADMIVSLLAVLKSGATYVPLDVAYPPARIGNILSALEIAHLIVHCSELAAIESIVGEVPTLRHIIVPDASSTVTAKNTAYSRLRVVAEIARYEDLLNESAARLANLSKSIDPAYIIFTSGSTGSPKGVVVCHRPVVNLIEWITREFAVGPDDQALFITSLCFDLSVYDIFGVLAAGASIRVASAEEVRDPRLLANLLLGGRVTIWDSAPAALEQVTHFLPERPQLASALRLAFLSGDWIPVTLPDRVRRTCPRAEIVALGGATEATIWSNYHRIREVPSTWSSIPYGRPIQNARYYILDTEFAPTPPGVAGDLYISGECLFTEYAQDPALTSVKLHPDPFSPSDGARMYRTGDRARYWADGTIEFLGRTDHQLKIRGYRVEAGEIQVQLNRIEGVRESTVIALKDHDGANQLAAFYVANPGEEIAPDKVRAALQAVLPEYMIPSRIIHLNAIPLTSNAKVDRNALTDLALAGGCEEEVFVEASSIVEQMLASIWSDVLRLERVNANASFFELGGHSLLATKLVAKIAEVFQIELPLRSIFEFPTITGLGAQIQELLESQIASETDSVCADCD